MSRKNQNQKIKIIKKDIDYYISFCKNRPLFNKETIKNCKNLQKLLDNSVNLIKYLDEDYPEKLIILNFFYVDNCKKPEIKVNPRIYRKKFKM